MLGVIVRRKWIQAAVTRNIVGAPFNQFNPSPPGSSGGGFAAPDLGAFGVDYVGTLARQRTFLTGLFLATVSLLLSALLSYQAGCVGHAKASSISIMVVTFDYGHSALAAWVLGLSLGAISFLVRPHAILELRCLQAAAWLIGSGALFWLISFQAEISGVQSCL